MKRCKFFYMAAIIFVVVLGNVLFYQTAKAVEEGPDIGEDSVAPVVSSITVPANGTYRAGDTLSFTVNFSEAVYVTTVGGTPRISLGLGTGLDYALYTEGTNSTALTFSCTVPSGVVDTNGITIYPLDLDGGTIKDAAGNDANLDMFHCMKPTSGILVDSVAPFVTSVTVPANKTYIAGDTLSFTVNFSETVEVNTSGGTPRISLTVGMKTYYATYIGGTGSAALTFNCTISSGDVDTDGITVGVLTANGGTIRDAAGNNANLTLNGMGSTWGILIDSVAPTVTSVNVPAAGSYKAGSTLDFTVIFSENVIMTGTDSTLGIQVGYSIKSATYQSNTANSITYRYTVQSGDTDSNGISVGSITLNTTTVKDTATNNAVFTLKSVGDTSGVLIDTTAPVITSVIVPSSGSFQAGIILNFIVNFSEAVTVSGEDSTLGIVVGGISKHAGYSSVSANSIIYKYTVQPGDNDSDGIQVGLIELNTTTITDTAANDAVLLLNGVGDTSRVFIDTIAPAQVADVTLIDNDTTAGIDGRDFSVSFTDLIDESDVKYKIYLYKDSEQPDSKSAMDAMPFDSKIAVKTIASSAEHNGASANLGSGVTTDSKGQALASGEYWVIICAEDRAGNYSFARTKASITNDSSPTPGGGTGSPSTPPKTEGTLEKDQQSDVGAPAASINNNLDTLKAGVLTVEEQSKVAAGENAKVILKIEDISKTVSNEDKKLVEEKLSADLQNAEATVLYVDISLFKKVGNGEETRVTQTSNKISISIEIPQELRNNNAAYSRTYRIVRIHDNEVEILDGIYDPATNLFTFETDRFSVYALTYQDTVISGSENTVFKDFWHLRLTAKATATTQKLSYAKVSGADGYLIYGAKCGKDMIELADVAGTVTSYTVKNLKKATHYKYLVKAYKIINGEKVIIAVSKTIHSGTTSKIYGNPVKITAKASSITLEAGNTKLLICEVVLPKGRKLQKHVSVIRYESTNNKIATISSSGKITAKSKGVCYVYAYAQNGVYKKIKITVK